MTAEPEPSGGNTQWLEATVLELLGKVGQLQAEIAEIAQENALHQDRVSSRLRLLNLRVRVLEAKLPDLCKRFKAKLLHCFELMGLSSVVFRDGASGTALMSDRLG